MGQTLQGSHTLHHRHAELATLAKPLNPRLDGVFSPGEWDGAKYVPATGQALQAYRPRSWAYWHHRLGLLEAGAVPPLPVRRFA